jgi:hypothetical protein
MTALQIIGACAAIILGLLKFWFWWRGKRDAQKNELLKSAEKVAEASLRVEQEARRTYEKVESVGADTPVADGNKLLSGGDVER